MSSNEALDLLRRHDPARHVEAIPMAARDALRDRIVAGRPSRAAAHAVRPRRLLSVALAVVGVVVVGAGGAWAAGRWSPVDLFQQNPQADNGTAGGLWKQTVVPGSTVEATTVAVPEVGRVEFWYASTAQKGWCGALRLPNGAWLGTGDDPLDAGGVVPGCFPTREQINNHAGPVLVINGFDYYEGDIDERAHGGEFWRVWFGKVTARGAARVTDLVSGRGAPVVHGDLFALAIPYPNPGGQLPLHLVAYDSDGKVVADERPFASAPTVSRTQRASR
jgi:hypothetical protein